MLAGHAVDRDLELLQPRQLEKSFGRFAGDWDVFALERHEVVEPLNRFDGRIDDPRPGNAEPFEAKKPERAECVVNEVGAVQAEIAQGGNSAEHWNGIRGSAGMRNIKGLPFGAPRKSHDAQPFHAVTADIEVHEGSGAIDGGERSLDRKRVRHAAIIADSTYSGVTCKRP